MFAFEHKLSGIFVTVYFDTQRFYFDYEDLTILIKYFGGKVCDKRKLQKLSKWKCLNLTKTLRLLRCYTKSYHVKKFIIDSICPVLINFKR
ncbi:se109 [Alphabaculovirus alterspexiguae]|uniref:Se109 n=1 Tax=Spodoptera exigua multiple nucleopolyhedrovirus TaxID=10454 RepID=A0A3G2JU46_9ABAC|nr:se109 [Spodoptera exigua multiple nucleopolyhedrovirus]AYN45069.1 se109 [Spodoptera exigua multiple nucleopolyhedrovirus]